MQDLLMRSMRWIPFMRKISAWILMNLYISQPDSGDQALEIAETMVRSGAIDIIVIDSVAALVPKTGDRGRYGGQPCGAAGQADVPGSEKTDAGDQ